MARETTEQMRQQLARVTGTAAYSFSDDARESFLDSHAERLIDLPIYGHGGNGLYYLYGTAYTHWEDGATVNDQQGNAVSGSLDPLTGVFSPDEPNPHGTLFISGTSFDLYAAAADLLEGAAAMSATAFDVSVDGNSYSRSQITKAFLEMAASYRKRARAHVGTSSRGDEQWHRLGRLPVEDERWG